MRKRKDSRINLDLNHLNEDEILSINPPDFEMIYKDNDLYWDPKESENYNNQRQFLEEVLNLSD